MDSGPPGHRTAEEASGSVLGVHFCSLWERSAGTGLDQPRHGGRVTSPWGLWAPFLRDGWLR